MAIIMPQEKKLNNLWCWLYLLITVVPLLFWHDALPATSYSPEELLLGVVLGIPVSIAFFLLDRRALNKAGLTAPHVLWAVLLPPVYFWKRANVTELRRKLLFWLYTVAYITAWCYSLMFTYANDIVAFHVKHEVCKFLNTHTGQKYGKKGLETHACESIFSAEFVDEASEHMRLEMQLKNGSTIPIEVQVQSDGKVKILSDYPW